MPRMVVHGVVQKRLSEGWPAVVVLVVVVVVACLFVAVRGGW